MLRRIALACCVYVCVAGLAAYPAFSGDQAKGQGRPSPAIPLKATFMGGNIQNGTGPLPDGQYYFYHQGERGWDVHCRILQPVEYGPLQLYAAIESGFRVNFYFDWPPVSIAVPNPAKCSWPPFLRSYDPDNPPKDVTDVYSGTVFLFETRNKFNEVYDKDGVLTLQNSGVYLNLSTMGPDEAAIAEAEIHFHDNSDRWWWLGKMHYPVLVRVTRYTTRPEEWTITPVTGSYPGWATPGAMELGSPNINKKVSGEWWCAFGNWLMSFELKLARM